MGYIGQFPSPAALTSDQISDGVITAAKITDNTITAAKIADGTVVAAEIADATITAVKLATDSVTTAKIQDSAITYPKVASVSNSAIQGIVTVAQGGLGANSFTSPVNGVSPLVYFDGTKFATDSTVTDVGYDTSNHILNSRILYANVLSGNVVAMAANSVNCSTATFFTKTISSAATITFDSPPATGRDFAFTLKLTNGGSNTITWPAAVKWSANTAPSLTSSGVDLVVFSTDDGGTTWRGAALTGFSS